MFSIFQTIGKRSWSEQNPFNTSVSENYFTVEQSVKSRESDAIIKYDFGKPEEYVIFNPKERNDRNNQTMGEQKVPLTWHYVTSQFQIIFEMFEASKRYIDSPNRWISVRKPIYYNI